MVFGSYCKTCQIKDLRIHYKASKQRWYENSFFAYFVLYNVSIFCPFYQFVCYPASFNTMLTLKFCLKCYKTDLFIFLIAFWRIKSLLYPVDTVDITVLLGLRFANKTRILPTAQSLKERSTFFMSVTYWSFLCQYRWLSFFLQMVCIFSKRGESCIITKQRYMSDSTLFRTLYSGKCLYFSK